MLNMNSPTVQAMLNNLPQGVGNMPVYYGNTPTMTSETTAQFSTPFPSPKEMLMQAGQTNIYAPTSFTPSNIVGGYNGYQAAFSGYTNPYMGYGTYGGYGMTMTPMDQDARERLEMAYMNGLSYDEQLISESNFYKTISRIVSKNLGRDEEEAKECESIWEIYNKYPVHDRSSNPVKSISIELKVGDTVVASMQSGKINVSSMGYSRNGYYVEQMKVQDSIVKSQRVARYNQLYDSALERQFDNTDMLTFFNTGANLLMADSLNKELYMQNARNASLIYDRDGFRKRLLENNGLRSRSETKAIDRYVGRYGVMPDGRPVTPGLDPAVASSFSFDPKTGQYSITAPNFISNRLEQARQSFIRSIDES